MGDPPLEICPGCKLALPAHPGTAHPDFGASPSCWALYGEVLAREYASPTLMQVHRLTVDAYAVQHPGTLERRAIQSVWVHLASLHLMLERGLSPDFARRVIGKLTEEARALAWLDLPADLGAVTVADVAGADASAHAQAVHHWADAVWQAWRPHHRAVATIADRAAALL